MGQTAAQDRKKPPPAPDPENRRHQDALRENPAATKTARKPKSHADAPLPKPADGLDGSLRRSEASPQSSIHHFQTTNLMRTIRMPSHKDNQQQITQEAKAAYAG